MKSPCEEVVWDVLPSIRAAIAEELVKRGLSQKEVSKLLGITPPAVSQYVSKKRGYNIVFKDEVRDEIGRLADDLMQGPVEDLVPRMCIVCRMLRGEGSACGPQGCKLE
ncbi:MAG TPA: helix-turn-helix domain-containing protein [Methanotrichaceae archaeon]|nr:helix-turn-helix domain-containing protein [Methanotrichaceae archaeon]